MISQNPADIGDKRIVGFLHSETDLVRDFNAKNAQAAAENGLPAPEPIPIPEPAHTGHGHSHGGHGHSHGGHGHSHGHPAPTPAPTPAPKPIEEAPKPAEEPIKPADLEMDAEIERLIKEEEERMKNVAEQPPLVLQSLPETPEAQKLPEEPLEPVTPEPIPEAPVPIAQYIQEPTTTPAPLEAPAPVENAPNLPTPTFSVDDLMAQAARDALNSNSIVPDAPKVEEPEPAPTPAEDPVVTPAPEELTVSFHFCVFSAFFHVFAPFCDVIVVRASATKTTVKDCRHLRHQLHRHRLQQFQKKLQLQLRLQKKLQKLKSRLKLPKFHRKTRSQKLQKSRLQPQHHHQFQREKPNS